MIIMTMTTKQCFNEYEAVTAEAAKFQLQLREAVTPLLLEAAEQGFKLRDMCNALTSELNVITAEMVLRRAVEKRRAAKQVSLQNEAINPVTGIK